MKTNDIFTSFITVSRVKNEMVKSLKIRMKNKTCILISMSYTMKVYICLGVWKWGKKKKKKPMRLVQEVLRKLILKGFRI